MELQSNDARARISVRFITYQSQFRATTLACHTHGTPIPAMMLERHKHHTSTIHVRKLELADNALTMAQNKLARLQLRLVNADSTGTHNAHHAVDTTASVWYNTYITL
jgi:hypothetical protein